MNFDVSMTTLSEVFLNLKGESAVDEPGITMCVWQKIKEKKMITYPFIFVDLYVEFYLECI